MRYAYSILILICLSFFFSPIISVSQNQQSYFKWIPAIDSNTPDWAVLMYSPNPDVYVVEDLRALFIQENGYGKDIHERNYTHWRMNISHLISPAGFIISEEPVPVGTTYLNHQMKSATSWSPIGPFETYNRNSEGGFPVSWQSNIYCFDQAESDTSVLVAGIEGGDLFKSNDKGRNWFSITENIGLTTPRAVRIDPNNADVIYFSANQNVYKSIDGGSSWTVIFNLSSNTANEINIDPSNSNNIYITGDFGLIRSTNAGSSFSQIYNNKCWDIRFHPTNSSIVYLLMTNPTLKRCEFFRSTNGGSSFSIQGSGWYSPASPADAQDIGAKIAVSPISPNYVYVALLGQGKAGDNGWIAVYKSTNSGVNWTNPSGIDGGPYDASTHQNPACFNPDGTGFHQGFYNFCFAASHKTVDKIWLGTLTLNESIDGGANFTRIGAYYTASADDIGWVHPDLQDMLVLGNDVWFASDGGLNHSTDELNTHVSRKKGIYNSTFWGFGQGWNEDIQVGGRYHNGNMGYHQSYGLGNHLRLGGAERSTGYVSPLYSYKAYFSDISDVIIPPTLQDEPLYVGSLSDYPNESYVNTNSSELVYDPGYSDHMYIGKDNNFCKSYNEGQSFEIISSFASGSRILEIEIGRTDPNFIYAVVRQNGSCTIYKSTDAGISWTPLTSPSGLNLNRLEIALNPEDHKQIWVISAENDDVFRSYNEGQTWQDMSNNIINGQNFRDIEFQGGNAIIYLLTTTGAYYWNPSILDWSDISAGLPALMNPLEMQIFYRDSKIRFADKGKGLWERDFVQPSDPIAQPMTQSDTIYCEKDTVQFDCYSMLDHTAASWAWTFDPQPEYVSSYSSRNPKVVFGAEGSYDVTLITGNLNGADLMKIPNMVTVRSKCNLSTVPGKAVKMISAGDFVRTGNFDITTNNLTISAWIKPDGVQSDYTGILMNETAGTAAGFNFNSGNNTLAYHWPGGAWWWNSGLIVPADKWSHVAMVATPNGMKVYLNGIPSTHTTTLNPAHITSFLMGSYYGWTSRNFKGEIDEVKVWNRSLTTDEIRLQRHITIDKDYAAADPSLIAYYQFNESRGPVMNRVDIIHSELSGSAVRITSDVPIHSGKSEIVSISGSGTYNADSSNMTLSFNGTSTPSGDIVVSHLYGQPNFIPSGLALPIDEYWIINNYGTNQIFNDLTTVAFDPISTQADINIANNPSIVSLFRRDYENENMNTWLNQCGASSITTGAGGYYLFSSGCTLDKMGQYYFAYTGSVKSFPLIFNEISPDPQIIIGNGSSVSQALDSRFIDEQTDNFKPSQERYLHNDESKIKILPNPFREKAFVIIDHEELVYVVIRDLLGKVVQYYNVDASGGFVTINREGLNVGTYLLEITGKTSRKTWIVIQ